MFLCDYMMFTCIYAHNQHNIVFTIHNNTKRLDSSCTCLPRWDCRLPDCLWLLVAQPKHKVQSGCCWQNQHCQPCTLSPGVTFPGILFDWIHLKITQEKETRQHLDNIQFAEKKHPLTGASGAVMPADGRLFFYNREVPEGPSNIYSPQEFMLFSVQLLCAAIYLFRKLLLLFTAGSQATRPCTASIRFSVGTPCKQFTTCKCVFTCGKVLKEYLQLHQH